MKSLNDLSPEERQILESDPELYEQFVQYQGLEQAVGDLRSQHGATAFLYSDWQRKPFPKQQAYYECAKPFAMFSGAQGSGKTKINIDIAASLALRRHPTIKIDGPVHLWIVGLSYQKVDQVLIPYFIKALPQGRIHKFDQKSYVMEVVADDGSISVVGFMSAEADVSKFQSNRLNAILFDEAPVGSRGVRIFRECLSRFKPGQTLYIRLAGTPWELPRFFRDTFYVGSQTEPEKVECIIVGLRDNPYVPKEQVEYQATKYVGKELRARIYGEFVALTGLVYDTMDPIEHICEDFPIPDNWPIYCGIDPTEGRRPWSIMWLTISPSGDHYVIKELEIAGTYQTIVDAIRSRESFMEVQYRAIDPFASKFNMKTGTSWISELAKLGLVTRKVDRSKRPMMRSYTARLLGDPALGVRPRLKFFRKGAAKTAQSFLNHEWDENGPGSEDKQAKEVEANDEWKDLVDATMYCLSFKPRYFDVDNYKAKRRMRKVQPKVLDKTFGY